MKEKLSYVIVTPYTVAKSRTGGVISRLLSQTSLEFVGAQMFAADEMFTTEYAKLMRSQKDPKNPEAGELLASYIEQSIGPVDGKTRRSLLLLFKGEDATRKLSDICGALYPHNRSVESLTGETIRDTYSDLIYHPQDPQKVAYFEPAVFTPRNQEYADKVLTLLASWLPTQSNLIERAPVKGEKREKTLVIIKPDNWRHASSKPGTIIDMFSRTGLRIVGMKLHQMSVAEALEFYGPVQEALQKKLSPIMGKKAKQCLEEEFEMAFSDETLDALVKSFGSEYAQAEFEKIVEFMSGSRPSIVPFDQRAQRGSVKCLILVYEGVDAISKIREVLGPTDPSKAPEGTVRREFGKDIMVNTAHASDSPESATREMKITRFSQNRCAEIISSYLNHA
ncbi:MAG: nucleoside-diphosphate kinase [Sphaerochaetaceae bacterium]